MQDYERQYLEFQCILSMHKYNYPPGLLFSLIMQV